MGSTTDSDCCVNGRQSMVIGVVASVEGDCNVMRKVILFIDEYKILASSPRYQCCTYKTVTNSDGGRG